MRGAGYPVRVNSRYIMSPSPIPRWDVPNLSFSDNINVFAAGREKRIYVVPPHTKVEPLEFEDVKFTVEDFEGIKCAASGEDDAFMDEIYSGDGSQSYVINDSNFLDKVRVPNHMRPRQRLFKYQQDKDIGAAGLGGSELRDQDSAS
jgi:alpha-D-ribose 1-methylphosphonate 5-phosphate C-P lyase